MNKAQTLSDMVNALVDARTSLEGVPMSDIHTLARLLDGEYRTRTVDDSTVDAPSTEFTFDDGSVALYTNECDDE